MNLTVDDIDRARGWLTRFVKNQDVALINALCDKALLGVLSEVPDARTEAKGPEWKRVLSDDLPDGTPVCGGDTLYAFDEYPGHWEYELPPLPTAPEER